MRRLLMVLTLVVGAGVVLSAAIPFTDNFTRANGALGTNWTSMGDGFLGSAALLIVTNAVVPDPGFPCAMAATGTVGTFSANQKSQVTIASVGSGDSGGPLVRGSGNWGSSSFSAYLMTMDNGSGIDVVVNNSGLSLVTGLGTTWAAGDIARLEAEGTTIRLYKNNAQIGSVSNSAIASGQPGMCGFNSSTGESLDDFTADNLSAAVLTRTLLLLGVGHHP